LLCWTSVLVCPWAKGDPEVCHEGAREGMGTEEKGGGVKDCAEGGKDGYLDCESEVCEDA